MQLKENKELEANTNLKYYLFFLLYIYKSKN